MSDQYVYSHKMRTEDFPPRPGDCPECGGRPGHNDYGRCDTCAETFAAACRPPSDGSNAEC
jgi:hypothetical protein